MNFNAYIKRRDRDIPYSSIVVPIGSVLATIALSTVALSLVGIPAHSFIEALYRSLVSFSTIRYAIPLILIGSGYAVAYRAGIWNIGGEGQFLAGALVAGGFVLYLMPRWLSDSYLIIAIVLIVGFLSGASLGLIPAALRIKLNVNEILSTLMLNYVLIQLTDFLVHGPWKGVREYGYPRSDIFPEYCWFPRLTVGGVVTPIYLPSLAFSIIVPIVLFLFLNKMLYGYFIRVVGSNVEAAKYAGIPVNRVVVLSFVISGGLAGLAGVGELFGVYHQLIPATRLSAGLGYTAILVAWLAKLNPAACIIAGYFVGSLISVSYTLQITAGISYGAVNLLTGLLLLSIISLDFLSKYTLVVRFRSR